MSTLHSPRFVLAALLATVCAVHAADDAASQRRRIERERAEVTARARAGEKACAERFVVSACLEQVRADRRAATQELDHQRALLDDGQRKQRAADRLARIQARQDAVARTDQSRPPPTPSARGEPAAASPQGANAEPAVATQPDPRRRRTASTQAEKAAATRRAEASKRRGEEVAARRAAVEQRNQERNAKRPPSSGLTIPATDAASPAGR